MRSRFLDPKTFEPYPGLVPIPSIILLNAQIDAERETKRAIPVHGDRKPTNSIGAPMYVGGNLRPCMKGLLQSTTLLEGFEGHTMRVAIAAEALNIGLTIEEAIELFKDQDDFKYEISRKQVKDI